MIPCRCRSLTVVPGVSHLQGKDGWDWFVVTDDVFHVTSVAVLRHFGPAGQPRNGTTLPCTASRCGGSQAPENPVGPRRFTLLSTGRGTERETCREISYNHPLKSEEVCGGKKRKAFSRVLRLVRTFQTGVFKYYWARHWDIWSVA